LETPISKRTQPCLTKLVLEAEAAPVAVAARKAATQQMEAGFQNIPRSVSMANFSPKKIE